MPTGTQLELTQKEHQLIEAHLLHFKMCRQCRTIKSDKNRWYAGVNRTDGSNEPVNNTQAFNHWYEDGGRDDFNSHWEVLREKLKRRLLKAISRAKGIT